MNDQGGNIFQEFELHLNAQQQEILDSMFEGPLFLQRLLAISTKPIESIEAASAFLDKHWQRLTPYMFRKGSSQTPKAMEALILKLSREPLDVFTIDFPAGCSLAADQNILLPVPGLDAVAVASPELLLATRTGRRHDGSFSLTRILKGYAVAIDFEPISWPKPTNHASAPKSACLPRKQPLPNTPGRRQSKPATSERRSGMAAQDFLKSFNNRVTAELKQQLAASRQFSTTRFADLSGWGVSGGLPSLPRRR